jgi:hypothetical protein
LPDDALASLYASGVIFSGDGCRGVISFADDPRSLNIF